MIGWYHYTAIIPIRLESGDSLVATEESQIKGGLVVIKLQVSRRVTNLEVHRGSNRVVLLLTKDDTKTVSHEIGRTQVLLDWTSMGGLESQRAQKRIIRG
jgi:hypothetical protein